MQLGHLLTRSGLTYPEVSSKVVRETYQWLKFPLSGLRAQSRVSPAVGLLTFSLRTGKFRDGISSISW